MVTAEQLLNASTFGRRIGAKGVLTTEEANERIKDESTLVSISNGAYGDGAFFLSDDHCFGVGIKEMEQNEFVPCTTTLPLQVVARETCPSGIVQTAEDYIAVFHEGEKQLTSMEELLDYLNNEGEDQ